MDRRAQARFPGGNRSKAGRLAWFHRPRTSGGCRRVGLEVYSTTMIVRPNAPPLTVAEYKDLPETGPRYQLIEGDLYRAPVPNRFHQDISRNLGVKLANYLVSHPIGVLYGAPFDVYLTETDVFQPDLLIVLNENRGILTEAGAEGAPDLVVEILSPKTRQLDLVHKKRAYARMGIKELWIIDPDQEEVAIYRFDQHPADSVEQLSQGEVSSPLLPGFKIALPEVFRRG
jgi:Uma2 family endonuclease